MTDNAFDTLADRLRSEAAQWLTPGHRDRLEAMAREVERMRSGAKTLGHIVEQQCRMALDATGMHHAIDEGGDGDWGAVWENLYDLMPRVEAAEKARDRAERKHERLESAIEALANEWDAADEHGNPLREGSLSEAADEIRALLPCTTPRETDEMPEEGDQ